VTAPLLKKGKDDYYDDHDDDDDDDVRGRGGARGGARGGGAVGMKDVSTHSSRVGSVKGYDDDEEAADNGSGWDSDDLDNLEAELDAKIRS
jgi:hypothetical protein